MSFKFFLQLLAAALLHNNLSTTTAVSAKSSRRSSAPPRPANAPDIEYDNHPFDQYRHLYDANYKHRRRRRYRRKLTDNDATTNNSNRKLNNTTNTAPNYNTTTLHPPHDKLYHPLRIQFDTRQLLAELNLARSTSNSLRMTKLYLLLYEVLPMTAQVWGDLLRVIPVKGGVYPLQSGGETEVYLPNDTDNNNDDVLTNSQSDGESILYNDPVRAFYCPDETTSGISGGADLLIYATVNRHCDRRRKERGLHVDEDNTDSEEKRYKVGSGGTLASALSCQRDQYDRPITGSIDFCLSGMDGTSSLNDVNEAIERKEKEGYGPSPNELGENVIVGGGGNGANLKWDGGWFGRGVVDVGLEGNEGVVLYTAGVAIHEIGHVLGISSDSLSYFRHPITGYPLTPRPFTLSTVTCVTGEEEAFVGKPSKTVMKEGIDQNTGRRYFEVTTPTVRRIVQNHFNCSKATGARLENQPTGADCFGSHFDERIFFTDIMGAVFSPAVNVLSPLVLAYLEDSGWYRANYQSEYVHIGTFGHGAGCEFLEENCIDSSGGVSEAMEGHFCNRTISARGGRIDWASSGPQQCDPTHTQKAFCDWVDTTNGPSLATAPEMFQYVEDNPNLRPYTFTTADYCPIAHLGVYSCFFDRGRATQEQLDAGEYFGADSRCVETDGSRSYSLCLQTICNKELGRVELMAGGEKLVCDHDGQVYTVFNSNGNEDAEPLRIKCPKAALICPELYCPANCAGRGECKYKSENETNSNQPLAQCMCDSEEDTSEGCFGTPLEFPASYGPTFAQPNRANKAVFLSIVGSLVIGLAIVYIVVRQWKARQNLFM